MTTTLYIIIAVEAVLLVAAAIYITYLIMRGRQAREMQQMQKDLFDRQLDAVKAQMSAETEKLLKQREEALNAQAEQTFKTLMGPLGKDLKAMQESFDAQKRSQTEGTASLKTAVEQAVKHLQDQTQAIGSKADNLASALKGQNKMAGTWGEVILYNMLLNEGMEEGRDFDREETLRDAMGNTLYNEDSGKRMRPDYILHYPDKTEVIVDAKTSMEALSDWFEAPDAARKAADLGYGYTGKAYFLMGTIWGSTSCGGNEITSRAHYWVAVDYLQKAKAADPSLSDDANRLIGSYSVYYPATADAFMYDLSNGQSYTVNCAGMSATTTVRTR